MNQIRSAAQAGSGLFFVVLSGVLLSGCGLLSGDDPATDLTTAEDFQSEPTVAVVAAVPAATPVPAQIAASPETAAAEPLPTAVTLPTAEPTPEPTVDRSQPTSYVVQTGDVLGLIAERFDVDIADLRRVNSLSGNLIKVGQTLTIPAVEGSTTVESASGVVGSTTAATPAPAPTPVSCGANAVGHCVQSGESLLGLASKYGISVESLRDANPGITGDTIRIGDLLTIPGQSSSTSTGTTGTTSPTSGAVVSTDLTPTPTPAPASNADCAARNPEYPYYHASDGKCYANPIGGDTAADNNTLNSSDGSNVSATTEGATFVSKGVPQGQRCPDDAPYYGQFEKSGAVVDGPACYPSVAVVSSTPTPTVGPTPTSTQIIPNYGDGPDCDEWEVVLPTTGKCWPAETATDAQKQAGLVSSSDS